MTKPDNNPFGFLAASYLRSDSRFSMQARGTGHNHERGPIPFISNDKRGSGDKKSVSDILVELIIDIQSGNTKLDEFKKKLDAAIYAGAESYGGIIRTTSLTDEMKSILIMLEPGRFEELKMKISAMRGVRIIGEKHGHSVRMSAIDPFSGNNTFSDNIHSYNCIRLAYE